jgi:hypothetical protein
MVIANRQILTEFIDPATRPLAVEQDDEQGDGKKLWMKGVFIQGDVENANGRIYPRDEIGRAVESITKRIQEHGPVAGELDHPEGLTISGQNVSHAIHQMWMEGASGYGKLLVLDKGRGEIVRSMIEAGINLGVSSRGSGSVDGGGRVSDFEIVTVDIVMTPSAPNAYPQPVFEALLSSRFGAEVKYLAELRQDRTVQKYFQKSLRDYLMSIRDEVKWRKHNG